MRALKPFDPTWVAALAIIGVMVASSAAFAQPTPPATIPDQMAPDTQRMPGSDPKPLDPARNLSTQLSERDGVIKPPENVDHSIVKPPPQTGAMPVIPPPGTPGGNPNVQPK
jgi:hypothetical protein